MHCVCFVHFWCDVCPTPTRNVELWIVISFLITIPLIDYYVFGHSITITFFSRLVERLQNMRNNASGDGVSNCILCGETFSFFTRHRHSPLLLLQCKNRFYEHNVISDFQPGRFKGMSELAQYRDLLHICRPRQLWTGYINSFVCCNVLPF